MTATGLGLGGRMAIDGRFPARRRRRRLDLLCAAVATGSHDGVIKVLAKGVGSVCVLWVVDGLRRFSRASYPARTGFRRAPMPSRRPP
jgi:hypothetical protein